MNGSDGIAPLKSQKGEIIFNDAEKATLLNEYFGSVYTTDNNLIDLSSLPSECYSNSQCVFFSFSSQVYKMPKRKWCSWTRLSASNTV